MYANESLLRADIQPTRPNNRVSAARYQVLADEIRSVLTEAITQGGTTLRDFKRVFDLVKDFGTSKSTKIDSIFDSLLCPDRPAYVTIPYCTSTASCSCTTPS
ncbi:MAG: hypothetical protein KZQ66_15525 [Candidatus Thiodiazotropha sp. (ex Lucinoma aequizonata)]|nr:hypothetical protein [Candidatus Thiodiazotropha sp. (ex Lucinoma aequizonata)]MCU7888114.1 hypothetical protein [Candidatus Thiodiazotropha sp. (ex Lucinoma aequizonata)]MCU7894439.1 hypothetical protein [Candidatus Thiodiazotropha sp. (ex Lucinoma aequizonata)]MCU7903227.1 hypothetical protein [Candidatus Thiodiazotropha sp. (ex Lucinoma aequizonata)]MCU7910902.1 hypothetical protein [Candidatus Thiodiazotropha sp. (ex Lucinoma aequizonata)]